MALKFKTCENCCVLWCSLQNLVEKALELLDQFQEEQEMKNQVGAMETSLVFRLSHESLGVRLHRNVSAPSHILFTPSLSLSTSPPPSFHRLQTDVIQLQVCCTNGGWSSQGCLPPGGAGQWQAPTSPGEGHPPWVGPGVTAAVSSYIRRWDLEGIIGGS